MTREFNSLEKIKKYYDEKTNTYVFKENGKYIDLIILNFNLNISANIIAKSITAIDITALNINSWDIKAKDINANNIDAKDINAKNIEANNILYYAVCFAYKNIKCQSIEGLRDNAKHFVLDGKIEIKNA